LGGTVVQEVIRYIPYMSTSLFHIWHLVDVIPLAHFSQKFYVGFSKKFAVRE
jgi:hypothetical protein